MSATLLWCALVLGTHATAAYINRHGIFCGLDDWFRLQKIPFDAMEDESSVKYTRFLTSLQNDTLPLTGNDITVYARNRKIVVEEVDKNGNSVVKELDLPDYDGSEELQEDRRRREQQRRGYQSEGRVNGREHDVYGCDSERENQRRKCLRRQKKLLRKRYRNWKELIRRIMKDLDGKIKTLSGDSRKDSSRGNISFMSGFSPENVKRKKE